MRACEEDVDMAEARISDEVVVLGSFGYGGREEGGEEPTRGPNTIDSILFPLVTS